MIDGLHRIHWLFFALALGALFLFTDPAGIAAAFLSKPGITLLVEISISILLGLFFARVLSGGRAAPGESPAPAGGRRNRAAAKPVSGEFLPARITFLLAGLLVSIAVGTSVANNLSPDHFKTALLATGAVVALSVMSEKRLGIWIGVALFLGLATLRTPETEFAHLRLVAFTSIAAIGLAGSGALHHDGKILLIRGLAGILILFGLDALLQGLGFPGPAEWLILLSGHDLLDNPFVLPESPATPRALSFLGNPNILGSFAAVGFFLLFAGPRDPASRIPRGFAAAAAVIALFFSYSRGAYLAVGLGLVVWLILGALRREIRVHHAVLAALVLVGGLLFMSDRIGTLFEPDSTQVRDRLMIWSGAWEAIRARPWLGWGLGGFGPAFSVHAPADIWKIIPPAQPTLDAHSDYLDFLVEGGAMGILLVLAALGLGAIRLRRRLVTTTDRFPPALVAAGVAGLVAMAFSSLAWRAPFALLLLLVAILPDGDQAAGRLTFDRRRIIPAALLLLAALSPAVSRVLTDQAMWAQKADRALSRDYLAAARGLRPEDPMAWYLEGRLGLPGTFDELARLADAYPGYRDVELYLSDAAFRANAIDTGFRWLSRAAALRFEPERARRRLDLAIRAMRWEEAVAAVELVGKIGDADSEMDAQRGGLLFRLGRPGEAVGAFIEAHRKSGKVEHLFSALDCLIEIDSHAEARALASCLASFFDMEPLPPWRIQDLLLRRGGAMPADLRQRLETLRSPLIAQPPTDLAAASLPLLYELATRRYAAQREILDRLRRAAASLEDSRAVLVTGVIARMNGLAYDRERAAARRDFPANELLAVPNAAERLFQEWNNRDLLPGFTVRGFAGVGEEARLLLSTNLWLEGRFELEWIMADGRVAPVPVGENLLPGASLVVPWPTASDVPRGARLICLVGGHRLEVAHARDLAVIADVRLAAAIEESLLRGLDPSLAIASLDAEGGLPDSFPSPSFEVVAALRQRTVYDPTEEFLAAYYLATSGADLGRYLDVVRSARVDASVPIAMSETETRRIAERLPFLAARLEASRAVARRDVTGARRLYSHLLGFNPYDGASRLQYARLLQTAGDRPAALREYRRLAYSHDGAVRQAAADDLAAMSSAAAAAAIRVELQAPPPATALPIAYERNVELLSAATRGDRVELVFRLAPGAAGPLLVDAFFFEGEAALGVPLLAAGTNVSIARLVTVTVPRRDQRYLWICVLPRADASITPWNEFDGGLAPLFYPADAANGIILREDAGGVWKPVGADEDEPWIFARYALYARLFRSAAGSS